MPLFVPSIYRHEQPVASTIWTIPHNLGTNGSQGVPVVDVYITELGQTYKIIPASVTRLTMHTIQLTFSSAKAGFAIVLI